MSSHQSQDRQYDMFQSNWLGPQRDAPFNLNFNSGGLGGLGYGNRYGEFDQFNRSSMVVPRPSSSVDSVDHVLRAVAQADHALLLRSGNEAYANALALHKGTKAKFESLQYIIDPFLL